MIAAGLYFVEHFELLKSLFENMNKNVRFCAAELINVFQRWREWKITHHRTEWVYYKQKMLKEELRDRYSMHVVRSAIEYLLEVGIIERRNNPSNGQDKTFQYRLNLAKLDELMIETGVACKLDLDIGMFEMENSDFTVENHTQDLTTESNTEILPIQKEEEKKIEEIPSEEKPSQCTPRPTCRFRQVECGASPTSTTKKIIPAAKKITGQDKSSSAAAREIFQKYEERLKLYGIRFQRWDGVAVVDNPEMESAIANCNHLPSKIIEAGLKRFLGYIGNEKNVRDVYALMVFEIKKGEKE